MDEEDLRRTLRTLTTHAPNPTAVAADADRRVRARRRRRRIRIPAIAAAAVAAVLLAALVGVAAFRQHAASPPPVASSIAGSATVGSNAPRPSHSAVQVQPTTNEARDCLAHFPNTVAALNTTVGAVTEVGPRPLGGWVSHMGSYTLTDKISFCLVPHGDQFDAIAITPNGKTYVQWTQDRGDSFSFPG